jgi:hypothetical protein
MTLEQVVDVLAEKVTDLLNLQQPGRHGTAARKITAAGPGGGSEVGGDGDSGNVGGARGDVTPKAADRYATGRSESSP